MSPAQMKSDVPKYAPSRREAHISSANEVIPLMNTRIVTKYFKICSVLLRRGALLELEFSKHECKELLVDVFELIVRGLEFNNIGLTLVDNCIDDHTLSLSIRLVKCGRTDPHLSADRGRRGGHVGCVA